MLITCSRVYPSTIIANRTVKLPVVLLPIHAAAMTGVMESNPHAGGDVREQAVLFAHELGHTLGLVHPVPCYHANGRS